MSGAQFERPDAFTAARYRNEKIGERFSQLRAMHRKASDAMWVGWLCSSFTDEEIELLRRFYILCPHDESLIAAARAGDHSYGLGCVLSQDAEAE